MIAGIKGKIEYLKDGYAVIDVGGIGYKVFLTAYSFGKLAGQERAELFVHTHVKEDAIDLYGFLSMDELDMFELLISISGVGPKSGLGILAVASPGTIKTAILNEDSSILTKVSGVGKKTAQRVILELKNKVGAVSAGEQEEAVADSDAIEALVTMGYSVSDAREALKTVPADVHEIGQRVAAALRVLGRK